MSKRASAEAPMRGAARGAARGAPRGDARGAARDTAPGDARNDQDPEALDAPRAAPQVDRDALLVPGIMHKVCFFAAVSSLGALAGVCQAYEAASRTARVFRHVTFDVPRFYHRKGLAFLREWANSSDNRVTDYRFAVQNINMPIYGGMDPHGEALLHKAIYNFQPLLIKALVMMGADVNILSRTGFTPRENLQRVLARLFKKFTDGRQHRTIYRAKRHGVLLCMIQLCQTHNSSEVEPRGSVMIGRSDLEGFS